MGITVLVVDDDAPTCEALGGALRADGFTVSQAESGHAAMALLAREAIDVVVSDIKMARGDGLDLLRYVRRNCPECAVILVTGFGTIPQAVEAMRDGAYDYLTKPVQMERLVLLVERAVKAERLAGEMRHLRQELRHEYGVGNVIGRSPALRRVLREVTAVAATDATVLIQGESGTGKELIARAIHFNSARADRPLVTVNCAALPEGVIESELFGHERGAFTSAVRQRRGRFELADTGTLFLDEVGDLSPSTQVKLLRVLEERAFERVGGTETVRVDVRFITATNRDLRLLVEQGLFRPELYYRVSVVSLQVPPLRERREDIPALVMHALTEFCRQYDKPIPGVAPRAMQALTAYPWPGNVRELRNCLERLVVMTRGGVIDVRDLPPGIANMDDGARLSLPLGTRLSEIEDQAILQTLAMVRGNKVRAARLLGIGVKTLHRRLHASGMGTPPPSQDTM